MENNDATADRWSYIAWIVKNDDGQISSFFKQPTWESAITNWTQGIGKTS